jgi:flagellar assembly protein FliH
MVVDRRPPVVRVPSWIPVDRREAPPPSRYPSAFEPVASIPESSRGREISSGCSDPTIHELYPAVVAERDALEAERDALAAQRDALARELEALRAAAQEIGEGLAQVRGEALAESESDVVRLAFAIAQKIAGREVSADPNLVAEWVREGIAALGNADEIAVAIAPDLAGVIPPAALRALLGAPELIVEIDGSIGSGRCQVRSKFARIDQSFEARVLAIGEALGIR